jgi:hypothetical protein
MRQFRQAIVWGCIGWISTCSYFDLRSNAVPLSFGMTPDAAAAALEIPLARVSGRRGSEIYYAEHTVVTTGLLARDHRLWLQFRNRRLTGWKHDWGRPSAW